MTVTTDRPRQAARPKRRTANGHRRLFLVDTALAIAFVLVINTPLTGLAIHEWLGIFIGVASVVHVVQHGNWIVSVRKRLATSASLMNRLNFVMLGLLFVAYGSIIASGLVISEVALPFLGVTPGGGTFWLWLHLSSVIATIWLTALHIAFNWTWTRNAITRYVGAPLAHLMGRNAS